MATGTRDRDRRPRVLLDASAAIALITADHPDHAAALEAVKDSRLGLAGHAWFETYSVLTRLPPPRRRSPADAHRILSHNFPDSGFLAESVALGLGPELARLGIAGGAVYDALVAATARQLGRRLISADARARPVYEALGVEVELIF